VRKEIHQIESLNEDLQKYLLSVEKLELELPSEGFEQPEKLTDEDIDVVVRNLLRVPEALACNYIEAHEAEGVEDPRVEEFRHKIHDMYDGVVLCKEVKPDPPVRGLYGYASIPLKENAVPQYQHPFTQHGERGEAMKKIANDWLEKKFIETRRMAQPKFCGSKKIKEFPMAGGSGHEGGKQPKKAMQLPPPQHRGCVGETRAK
jgi:hypothetical protein